MTVFIKDGGQDQVETFRTFVVIRPTRQNFGPVCRPEHHLNLEPVIQPSGCWSPELRKYGQVADAVRKLKALQLPGCGKFEAARQPQFRRRQCVRHHVSRCFIKLHRLESNFFPAFGNHLIDTSNLSDCPQTTRLLAGTVEHEEQHTRDGDNNAEDDQQFDQGQTLPLVPRTYPGRPEPTI